MEHGIIHKGEEEREGKKGLNLFLHAEACHWDRLTLKKQHPLVYDPLAMIGDCPLHMADGWMGMWLALQPVG